MGARPNSSGMKKRDAQTPVCAGPRHRACATKAQARPVTGLRAGAVIIKLAAAFLELRTRQIRPTAAAVNAADRLEHFNFEKVHML